MTIIPAYGRDYTSKAAVLKDWNAGKDFVVADMSDPDDGRYINLQDAKKAGKRLLNVRYQDLTKVAVINIDLEA